MTENELRETVATWGNKYKGITEGSSAHKELINIFNDSGLCTRYKMTTSDAWCAMFVSDAFIATNLTSIFPCVECYCPSQITMAKNAGIWVEDDAYTPKVGDVIMYDWDDSGSGDCTGTADHVGIVQSISGTSFTVLEGNKSDTVGTRSMTVNGRYIRGYITPNYASAADSSDGTGDTGDTGDTGSTGSKEMTTTAEPKTIWDFLYSKLGNAYGTAGMMGNLYAESALIPINLQDSFESKLGYTDKSYTTAVDNGTYTKFSSDSAGYGLAQWTYSTRKKALLSYVQSEGASVGNLDAQLGYLWKELQSDYSSLVTTLKNATSVRSASDAVLTKFEQPADQGSSVQSKRASYGQTYYDQYASGSSTTDTGDTGNTGNTGDTGDTGNTGDTGDTGSTETKIDYADYYDKNLAGTYTVTASSLNLRAGAGESKTILLAIPKGDTVKNYGYYSTVSGTNWLLVEYVKDSTTYTGFASSKYLNSGDDADGTSQSAPLYYIKVSVSNLNIRAGAGTNYATKGHTGIGVFGITQEKTGQVNSGTGTYGKLLSGVGWVWLGAQHVTKL